MSDTAKRSKSPKLDKIYAQDAAAAAKGLEAYAAHRRAVYADELAELRRLRAECVRKTRLRNLEKRRQEREANKPQLQPAVVRKKARRNYAKKFRKVIRPGGSSRHGLRFVRTGLRDISDGGTSIHLTPTRLLAIERLDEPVPSTAIEFVESCSAAIATWLNEYQPHLHCPPDSRPRIIAGEPFGVRCSHCYEELRLKAD